MFIKLTSAKNNKPVLVNVNEVKAFFSGTSNYGNHECTDVEFTEGAFEVKETVEEIQEMLEQNEEYRRYVKLIKEVPDVH